MTRNNTKCLGLIGAGALLAFTVIGCGEDGVDGLDGVSPPNDLEKALADSCGIDISCGNGLAKGNASISGVASVDTFFQSVLNFQARADMVASGIDAEIAAIGAAFGIEGDVAAGLKAQISANLEGGLEIDAQPARCQVDAKASVEASARCEGEVTPPMVTVDCQGSCEVEASADVQCDANAELECTVAGPELDCMVGCTGTCTVEGTVAADCSGTCHGTCMGTCSAMNTEGECAGQCDGECKGSCEFEVAGSAMCEGKCSGECTAKKPSGGCEGAVRASCKAKADASIKCEGRCDGEVTPPMASVECKASAKAEASMNVECTPPRVAINYRFKAGVNAEAQAKFEAGLRVLEARLPALLASVRKAELVGAAGVDLGASANGAVKGALADINADANLRVKFGLVCAATELPKVAGILSDGAEDLEGSLDAAVKVTAELGLGG